MGGWEEADERNEGEKGSESHSAFIRSNLKTGQIQGCNPDRHIKRVTVLSPTSIFLFLKEKP